MSVQSGNVAYPEMAGGVTFIPSCQACAKVTGFYWHEALFEGTCDACGVELSGNPSEAQVARNDLLLNSE